MPLVFVRLLGTDWALLQVRSACILFILQYLQWAHLLSFILYLPSGEISGGIFGQRKGIRGTIYNKNGE